MTTFTIAAASERDVPTILQMIKALAEYEKLSHAVTATEARLRETLFGPHPAAEVIMAHAGDRPAGFALFFHNYSTFLGQRGLYLEDLFVVPEWRGHGLGRLLLSRLAAIALDRDCGRLEWSVLDWNTPAIGFYRRLGAVPMEDWTIYRLTGDALSRLAAR
ncbi:MAG TPA: GNAT family N-acetyltransferase [Vicinamibacterales bacterium]|jgi:GNAT superfamily N-acetyltransferase|nr:GNAT family N-acetyltransferase [Vicinamibacterales bacterium]